VLLFAAAGYAWLGNWPAWSVSPGSPATAQESAPHSTQKEQIDAMIDKLAARLKDKPDDPEGWAMLGRSYNSQGRQAEALAAYKKALDLRPEDAQALADYADALAVTNNRTLEGEPERLIMKAVQLDPMNVKALALAGTIAFNKSDFRAAVGYWDRAVAQSDPQSDFTKQLQGALAEARQRAGMAPADSSPVAGILDSSPAAGTADATPNAPTAPAATGSQGGVSVSGRVTLSAAAKAQVKPDDTVFIFARAVNGPKMPLAILRKKVSDLPLDFSLDDSMAMSPAARLSSVKQVVVGARVSKTGSAMPGPGDWQGISATQTPGAQGIQIDIAEPVR
jgi:cytochrome c-type biogenesis protein CcmH